MAGELQFAAFLSYSRKDVRLARWLVRTLEEFRPPRQTIDDLKARSAAFTAARPIFRDEHDMPVGGVISDRLSEVLDASHTMIVLCTASSVKSDWVNREIGVFASRHPGRRIIPVVAEGEPESDESYPPALLKLGKPLAADLRNPAARKQAVIKIAAAVLGLDVDQLVGRVQKRQAEQRRWLAGGSAAAAAVVIGLGVMAGVMANNAKQANDRAYGQVAELLTNTRANMGGLAAKKALHEAAKLYFDSKAGQRLSDRDLLLRAEWLRQEGKDAFERGEHESSLAKRQEALAVTSELLGRKPSEPDFLFSHAQSAYWVGDHYARLGDRQATFAPWTVYKETSERLLAVAPEYANDDSDARSEVSYANVNIGLLLLEERRDPRAAAIEFSSALKVLDPKPEGLEAKLNLSRVNLHFVSALAQYASAQEVFAAVELWQPLLLDLDGERSSSRDVDVHLANAWDKIINVFEKHAAADVQPAADSANGQPIVGDKTGSDPDDVVSLTFAAEMRLRVGDEPDCSKLPELSEASVIKSEELRLTNECMPRWNAKERIARCSWFANALEPQPDRFALEPVWAKLLVTCSRSAEVERDAELLNALDRQFAEKFSSRSFEEMRLWTQIALVELHSNANSAWIKNLRASLHSRSWAVKGNN